MDPRKIWINCTKAFHTEGSIYVWRLKIVNLFGLKAFLARCQQTNQTSAEEKLGARLACVYMNHSCDISLEGCCSGFPSQPDGFPAWRGYYLPLGWALRLRKPGCALWSETVSNTRLLAWPQLPGELPPTIYHSARTQRRTSCQNWNRGTEFLVIQFES